MYLTYWGLTKNPFDSVPDPGMYFSAHTTVENTVAELLFAIEEGNECLAVVVGDAGLGKTMTLRVVLNEVDSEKYRIAYVTNPDVTFAQLLREVIGQLKGEPCSTRGRDALLEEFNRILFETADAGRKVLIFIDEGNAMSGHCLEGLRLLTNMQEDSRNLMTIILAGQPRLARMLEDPRRANLFQRVGVYSKLEPLASEEQLKHYVHHRLERAGVSRPLFDDTAIQAIHDSCDGIPRLINRVCKLSLKAGETHNLEQINAEIVRVIADRFGTERRKKRGEKNPPAVTVRKPEDPPLSSLNADVTPPAGVAAVPGPAATPTPIESRQTKGRVKNRRTKNNLSQTSVEPASPPPTMPAPQTLTESSTSDDAEAAAAVSEPTQPLPIPSNRATDSPVLTPYPTPSNGGNGHSNGNGKVFAVVPPPLRGTDGEASLHVPEAIVTALCAIADERQRIRLAGQFAAKQIQDHPELYTEASIDPVKAWDNLRAEMLRMAS